MAQPIVKSQANDVVVIEANNIVYCKQTIFDDQGKDQSLEFWIDLLTDRIFTGIRSYSRMSKKARSTISKRFEGVRKTPLNMGAEFREAPTEGGLQGVRLIEDWLMAEWLLKDNPELLVKFAIVSIKQFAKGLAGIQNSSQAIALPEEFPRLAVMMSTKVIDETLANPFTIREFLEHYDINLDPGDRQALSHRVANVYRSVTGRKKPPRKNCSITGAGVHSYPSWCQSLVNSELEMLTKFGSLSSEKNKKNMELV